MALKNKKPGTFSCKTGKSIGLHAFCKWNSHPQLLEQALPVSLWRAKTLGSSAGPGIHPRNQNGPPFQYFFVLSYRKIPVKGFSIKKTRKNRKNYPQGAFCGFSA
jgi:hypothetical protein